MLRVEFVFHIGGGDIIQPPTDICIEYVRADGALDIGHVNVISDEEETARIRQDSFQKIRYLVEKLEI